MWYLWLIVGLGAVILFIKRYDGSRQNTDFGWISDLLSDFDSDDFGDLGGD